MDKAVRVADWPVSLLITAAICALLLSGGAGALVYRTTRRLVDAEDRVERSQQLLTTLQTISQSIDRVESTTSLYQFTHQDSDLRGIRNATLRLQTNLVRLKALASDEPSQSADQAALSACAANLTSSLDTPEKLGTTDRAAQIFACRETTAGMQERERTHLEQLTARARSASIASLTTGSASAALAAALSVALFSFLVRDARHQRVVSGQIVEANRRLAETVQALETRVAISRLLASARDELQLCVSAPDAYASTARFVEQLMPGTSGALCIINNSRQTLERMSWWGKEPEVLDSFPLDSCCGLRSGHLRWRADGLSEVQCSHFPGAPPQEYLCIPMAAMGETLGVVYVGSPRITVLSELAPLRELIELTSMALASLQLRQKLESQSIRDSLTGLFNRHFMEIALGRELRRAARQRTYLAVFMLDVDRFKDFNDTFGHEAGDNALREIAAVLASSIRSEDVACRYGGEEFVIILPEIQPNVARERAECVRRAVGEMQFSAAKDVTRAITVSIGIAMYPDNGDSPERLLRAADRNLYKAKRLGRNQVVLPEPGLAG
jgi:diguanylate cyclase (GGDEF)-like protein